MSSPWPVPPELGHASSTSTVKPRNPSPLNPSSSLPDENRPSGSPTPPFFRPRGRSTSTIRTTPTQAPSALPSGSSLSRVLSSPGQNTDYSDLPTSTFLWRARSKSPALHTPPNGTSSTWWNGSELIPRPWRDSPKRKKTIPSEQTESWEHTQQRVAKAAVAILGTAGDVAHEALLLSVDVLEFAPIMGLSEVARTLLSIWDAVQLVDMNRLACLRLTERCADILLSIRQEVKEAGDRVSEELRLPINKLTESFDEVHTFLQKQIHRPFLKRYLKREEILRQIAGCHANLTESVAMFSLSVQIRILKQVQDAELHRQADTQAILDRILAATEITHANPPNALLLSGMETDATSLPPSSSHPTLSSASDLTHLHTDLPGHASSLLSSPSALSPAQIQEALRNLHSLQNSADAANDMADLRQLMRAALQTSSDVDMVEVLQVGRDEMPEAIKTLQRALERVVERESPVVPSPPSATAPEEVSTPRPENLVALVRRASTQPSPDAPVAEPQPSTMQRSKTVASTHSSTSGSVSDGRPRARDTLDREFIESGIDALRRMSQGMEVNLPSWTITRYEVDRDVKIGLGFFSDVYKGVWRQKQVAIKVLAATTPRKLFIREAEIWKGLRHPNVLELYGASSACGEPPWFFVSPYLKNGSLVDYLRKIRENTNGVAGPGSPGGRPRRGSGLLSGNGGKSKPPLVEVIPPEVDPLKMMHEIAKGMEYLHSQGVLHGDLKGANVLIDDRARCVITDFGQSEMRSEAYRVSGKPQPHGTLRWQAPELMAGQGQLTTEMDVYAYAICCMEILTMGRMPWPLMDDDAVRHFVLKENTRPPIPATSYSTPALQELLRLCWHRDPFIRPSFSKVVWDVRQLRVSAGSNVEEVPSPWSPLLLSDEPHSRPSPDMRPIPLPAGSSSTSYFPRGSPRDQNTSLPAVPADAPVLGTSPTPSDSSFRTARDNSQSPPGPPGPLGSTLIRPRREDTVTTRLAMPEPVFYTPSGLSSRASSIFASTPSTQSAEDVNNMPDYEGYDSPPPADERIAELRNERRYRLLLSHEFHPSLTLPLWSPLPVKLGSVGYLSKPSGSFVTLFNALDPFKSSGGAVRGLPSVYGYGTVNKGSQRQDKRNAAQRGLDAIAGLLTFRSKGDGPSSQNVSRRYSFQLRTGHKTAYICTESTTYNYITDLDAPKKWFKSHIDTIMEVYSPQHRIQREDVFLVIGTLNTPDYALFVSHNHPDGQAHFNVFSAPKTGQPWGAFTTDTGFPSQLGGPVYHEAVGHALSASKVSYVGSPPATVLVARLRFKPDVAEPTSL